MNENDPDYPAVEGLHIRSLRSHPINSLTTSPSESPRDHSGEDPSNTSAVPSSNPLDSLQGYGTIGGCLSQPPSEGLSSSAPPASVPKDRIKEETVTAEENPGGGQPSREPSQEPVTYEEEEQNVSVAKEGTHEYEEGQNVSVAKEGTHEYEEEEQNLSVTKEETQERQHRDSSSESDVEDRVDAKRQKWVSENLDRHSSWALKESQLKCCGTQTHTWGRGDLGQLATGHNEDISLPQQPVDLANRHIRVAAGNLYNTIFILDDGDLLICGNNDNHQLGFASKELRRSNSMSHGGSSSLFLSSPRRISALDAFAVHSAAVGSAHVVAVVADGSLTAWGCNDFGQLGLGEEGEDVTHPRLIRKGRAKPFVRVAAGDDHTLALTSAGTVLSAGNNAFGQLGHTGVSNLNKLTEIKALWPLGIVQISCGENHSAALTADGRLFTWGRGKYGQLGHGSGKSPESSNQHSPKEVHGVLGRVVQVACGGNHTLALTSEGQIFSWGLGTSGQLGHGDSGNISAPTRCATLNTRVIQVSAGSEHSLALTASGQVWAFGSNEHGQLGLGKHIDSCFSPQQVEVGCHALPPAFVLAAGQHSLALCFPEGIDSKQAVSRSLSLPCLQSLVRAAIADPSHKAELQSAVGDIFGTPGYLAASFESPDQAAPAHGSNLDFQKIFSFYIDVLKLADQITIQRLLTSTGEVVEKMKMRADLLEIAADRAVACFDERVFLRALLVLLQNPINQESAGRQTMKKIVRTLALFVDASRSCSRVFEDWIGALPADFFASRILRPLQRHLSFVAIRQSSTASREELLEAARVLYALYLTNEHKKLGLAYADFENVDISEGLNLVTEYAAFQHWLSAKKKMPQLSKDLVSVCQLSFLLSPQAKSKVLQIEADWQKHAYMQQGAMQATLLGSNPLLHQYLILSVRRESLLRDALVQISSKSDNLKKPLKVIFSSNGLPEEGVDQGGVAKEFFQLLMKQLFEQDYGMFVLDEDTRNFWFNFMSDSLTEFKLVGWLFGLAVYNNVILDAHFPPILYKKLNLQEHEEMGFEDLKQSFPGIGQGLQQLLDFDGNVEVAFSLNFEVEYNYFGELRKHPLKPGGSEITLTNDNREEYVELMTRWKLHESVSSQFEEFARGFREVCGGPALEMFRSDELELLICGLPELNFEELQAVARYDGGYNQEHPTVKALWQCLHAFTTDQKKLFLKFTTGCDRAPVGGLGNLVLVIQRSGPDGNSLPTAHTCFNYLLLPEYSSIDKLRAKLVTAIDNSEGFGLQ